MLLSGSFLIDIKLYIIINYYITIIIHYNISLTGEESNAGDVESLIVEKERLNREIQQLRDDYMSLHTKCDHLAEQYKEKLEEEESRNAALKRANVQLRNVYQLEREDKEKTKREAERRVRELTETLEQQQKNNLQLQQDYQREREEHQKTRRKNSQLEEIARQHEQNWKVRHEDVTLTKEELGRGAWGAVRVGVFREQRVAVKELHMTIAGEHSLALLNREINTMSKLRHPNLLLFIGAVLDHPSGHPLIITEIMDTSLRQAYEKGQLTDKSTKLSVLRDTAAGLNYLHCHPDEIIHRDVSSANVLLESRGPNKWRAKLSDFGSANVAPKAFTQGMGTLVYSAPESIPSSVLDTEKQQLTTKMDVFSYGVLLCEVLTSSFPDAELFQTMLRSVSRSSPPIGQLVQDCINRNPMERPTMKQVIQQIDKQLK